MIRDYSKVEAIISEDDRKHPLTLAQKYTLLNGMYKEAQRLGHFSAQDITEGLEEKIILARIMNTDVRPDS